MFPIYNQGNPISISTIGRMKHQSVLIITPLDNPDHVEIVQLLCRYLKDWCGVDTTYFAFDEATGIGVSQNDPWKWCQVGNLECMAQFNCRPKITLGLFTINHQNKNCYHLQLTGTQTL